MSVQRNTQGFQLLRRLAPSLLAGLVMCAGTVSAWADTPASVAQTADTHGQATRRAMVVDADSTFLREKPHVQSVDVMRLERGDRVEVLDASGTWYRVRAGKPPREGFVHRGVLSALPQVSAPSSTQKTPASTPRSTTLPTSADRPGSGAKPATATQPTSTSRQPAMSNRARQSGIGIRGLGLVGWMAPLAHDSFEAVGLSDKPLMLGGGGEVTNLFGGVFVRGTVERWSGTGERTFLLADGARVGLGIPLSVRMTPIDVTAGWRFARLGRGANALTPYVGGGAGVVRYEESDPFAVASENVDTRFTSYHALAGAEVGIVSWLGVKAEYRYRAVPDSLGAGGVSKENGHSSLGGSTLGFALVLGR